MKAENSKKAMLNEMMTLVAVMSLIFIFASIGIISYMIRFIQNRMREFSIHMICGASDRDILIRVSMQILFVLCIAILVAIAVFGFSLSVLYMAAIGTVYCFGILFYPYIVLKKSSLIEILRSNAR